MKGNTVSIKGNITRDAELRTTAFGNTVAQWGIAWNQQRKNQQTGQWEDFPSFFDCKCWLTDKQAAVVQAQLKKGNACAIVDGHLVQERWDDQNGNKHSKAVIMVDDPIGGMAITTPKRNAAPAQPGSNNDYVPADTQPIYQEDIPF